MIERDGPQEEPVVKSTVRARGAVRGHNVRYVLAISLIGTIVVFIIIAIYFGVVQF
jgi:hypothetical protein